MGKGDKRTKRGKVNVGSFGNSRKKARKTKKPILKRGAKPGAAKKGKK